LPVDQAIAEEEQGFARALTSVDVGSEVAIVVTDEARGARRPGERSMFGFGN